MNWKVHFYEMDDLVHCVIRHPKNNYKVNGEARIVKINEAPLNGWTPPSYIPGDEIVIVELKFDSRSPKTDSNSLNIKRSINNAKEHVVVVPVENMTGGGLAIKGPGKRTSKKVSDELGWH